MRMVLRMKVQNVCSRWCTQLATIATNHLLEQRPDVVGMSERGVEFKGVAFITVFASLESNYPSLAHPHM